MRGFSVSALLLVVLPCFLLGCSGKSETDGIFGVVAAWFSGSKTGKSMTKEQAASMVYELLEVQNWSKALELSAQGDVRAAVMPLADVPKVIDGEKFWMVDCYESHPTHMVLWTSFLVKLSDRSIWVNDPVDGVIRLQAWRSKNSVAYMGLRL